MYCGSDTLNQLESLGSHLHRMLPRASNNERDRIQEKPSCRDKRPLIPPNPKVIPQGELAIESSFASPFAPLSHQHHLPSMQQQQSRPFAQRPSRISGFRRRLCATLASENRKQDVRSTHQQWLASGRQGSDSYAARESHELGSQHCAPGWDNSRY